MNPEGMCPVEAALRELVEAVEKSAFNQVKAERGGLSPREREALNGARNVLGKDPTCPHCGQEKP